MGESFTTNIGCGGISSGTTINSSDKLQEILHNMLWKEGPPDPPTEYSSEFIGTLDSLATVNEWCNIYNYENGYQGLKLGNRLKINNIEWEIAGFNLEHNQTAADGTVYDNGYGILMVPGESVSSSAWNVGRSVGGGYKSSTIHTSTLQSLYNTLSNLLGDHIILRNVLLSSSVDMNNGYTANNYTWYTTYLTSMSVGQCTGTFASNKNKYDDGEATYKLPLFNHESCGRSYAYWVRNIWGRGPSSTDPHLAYYIPNTGIVNQTAADTKLSLRPTMLIR